MRLPSHIGIGAYQRGGYSPSNPSVLENRLTSGRHDPGVSQVAVLVTRSSRLPSHLCWIEMFSFLPDL